jgi:UDP-N-acetylmuramate--alanine ligase
MAIAMAVNFNTQPMPLQKPASFKGIRRQFSYQIKTDNLVYIDDYAHHPANYAVYQAVGDYIPIKSSYLVSASFVQQNKDFADDLRKVYLNLTSYCC